MWWCVYIQNGKTGAFLHAVNLLHAALPPPSPLPPVDEVSSMSAEQAKAEIIKLNTLYKGMKPQELHVLFKENPTRWQYYHAVAAKNFSTYSDGTVPYQMVIKYLQSHLRDDSKATTKQTESTKALQAYSIADFGCGTGHLARHFQKNAAFRFTNIDHVAFGPGVIECDMSRTPLPNNSQDMVIFCLSLSWGSPLKETSTRYLQEAKRVLRDSASPILIVEPVSKWTEWKRNTLEDLLPQVLKYFLSYIRTTHTIHTSFYKQKNGHKCSLLFVFLYLFLAPLLL